MGYEMFILSDVPSKGEMPDEMILWHGCGWEIRNVLWSALAAFGESDKFDDEAEVDYVKLDTSRFKELSGVLGNIIGTYPKDTKRFATLAFDWDTYRRLVGLCEYGYPDDFLIGIGKERFGIMRSCFFVGSDDSRVNNLCDALCGMSFDENRHDIESVIKIMSILIENDVIYICQSF